MNKGNWFLLIAGLCICWIQYRKRIESPNRILEIWGPHKESLIGDEANQRCDEAQNLLRIYRASFSLAAALLTAAVTNWQFNYVSGPIFLALSGSAICVTIFNLRSKSAQIAIEHEKSSDKQDSLENRLLVLRKNLVKGMVAVLAISGFWSYRIQQDMNEQKQSGINEALELTDTGWCSNFWDIDTSGGLDNIVKTGGWPCIQIGSVRNITFTKKATYMEMCFNYTLTRSSGLPSSDEFNEYRYEKLCSTDSWYIDDGGWSTSSFEDKIYEKIKLDLETNRTLACNRFYYSLSAEERIVYC